MKTGELCAGYNGLGMAVEEVFGATPAWFSEYDAAPSKILAHHYPDVPNYGDMTKIDWAAIEPVDIISGGTPCQDLSAAGKRKGMTEGTRSNLWVQMREAIAIQKPKYVVWENVRGAYSATASSDLEQCPGCMGDAADRGTVLRALGRVLGDLSDLGFNAEWRGLRAADVGACHSRFRVFVLARRQATNDAGSAGRRKGDDANQRTPKGPGASSLANEPNSGRVRLERAAAIEDPNLSTGDQRRLAAPGQAQGGRTWPDAGGRSGAPTTKPKSVGGREGRAEHARLQGGSDAIERGASTNWGDYASAIRRWEEALGRRAPSPTEPTGRSNAHRLSPRFTEWMMGLPDGWVTDPAIGISRNEQLKACGNGVVPQQAKAALLDMLRAFDEMGIAA